MLRGGVLLRAKGRADRDLFFVPAEVVRRVVVLAAITPVEGLRPPAFGITLVNGEIVCVLCPSPAGPSLSSQNGRTTALLCDIAGKRAVIAAHRIEATGLFVEERKGFVRVLDEEAEIVDVEALYRSAEEAIWSERKAIHPEGEVFP